MIIMVGTVGSGRHGPGAAAESPHMAHKGETERPKCKAYPTVTPSLTRHTPNSSQTFHHLDEKLGEPFSSKPPKYFTLISTFYSFPQNIILETRDRIEF